MATRQYNYKGRNSKPSKSQRKRDAFNYRAAYFRKNPGLFGCIWFCSQCGIPMFGQHNVQVDHIIPLAGLGINRTINTVAICPKCNREKSDNGGVYIVKGVFAKLLEVILFTVQKVILWSAVYVLRLVHFILNSVRTILSLLADMIGLRAVIVILTLIVLIVFML